MGRIASRRVVAAVVLAALLAACGGDDGGGEDTDAGAPADTGAESGADAAAVGDEADGGGAGAFTCAVTAEQVGEVLGTAVEKNEETCGFLPGGNVGSVPSATFVAQPAEMCDEQYANQLGYTEPVADMFGEEAYIQTGGAADARVLVCSDAAFEVVVDDAEEGTGSAEASAETLALIAMEAESAG